MEEMDVDAIVRAASRRSASSTSSRTRTFPAAAREALRGRARDPRRRHSRHDRGQHPAPGDAERRRRAGDGRARPGDRSRYVSRSRRRGHQRRRDGRGAAQPPPRGKIYRPEKVEQALSNFFRKGNLSTLRELALRAVADEVGEKAASYRAREGLEPALIPERVMVCMSSNTLAPRVIRTGARIAGRLGSRWYAVYVETPREKPGASTRAMPTRCSRTSGSRRASARPSCASRRNAVRRTGRLRAA